MEGPRQAAAGEHRVAGTAWRPRGAGGLQLRAPARRRPRPRPREPRSRQVGRRWSRGHPQGSEGSEGTSGGSTRAHLRESPGKEEGTSPSLLADGTESRLGGPAPGGPLPRPARTPPASRARSQGNFLLEAGHVSPAARRKGRLDCLMSLMSPHLCGSQDFPRKALQSQPKRARLPGRARALSRLGRVPTAPPRHRAAPLGARPRRPEGTRRGAGGPLRPAPQRREHRQNNKRPPPPLPHRTPARAAGAGEGPFGGWPAARALAAPSLSAAPRVRARNPALERGQRARGPRGGCSSGHGPRPAPQARPGRGARPVPCRWPCLR